MSLQPSGYEFTLLLSFDFDSESAEVWKGSDPVAISRGRYGARVGIWRVLELLDKYGLRVTFFVPGWVAENYPRIIADITNRGHEIAGHGYMHERFDELPPGEELRVIELMERYIQNAVGSRPLGFRAPYWRFSPRTLSILASRGYVYDSSLMDSDDPYTIRLDDNIIVELPVDWRLDDWPLLEIERLTPREVLDMWIEEIEYAHRRKGYLSLTFHPQCIGRGARIRVLEEVIKEALRRRAWIPRAIDVARKLYS